MTTELPHINDVPNDDRATKYFDAHRFAVYKRADRIFAVLMPLQWLAGIVAAYFVSPLTWTADKSSIHPHLWYAVLVGGAITSLPLFLTLMHPGKTLTRYTVAVSQMLMSGLLIHLSGGRIETHFHIFGSLAFLSFYRDWRILIPATLVTGADHLLRGWLYPASMYGVLSGSEWRWMEHAGWVLFENFFLIMSIRHSVSEMRDIALRASERDASEERYRAVVEQTQEGIALLHPETLRVIECNVAFSRLIGCASVAEAQSLTAYDYNNSEETEISNLAQLIKTNNTPSSGERGYRQRNGSIIPVEVTSSIISYDGKKVFCIVAKNITERKRAANDLKQAYDDLELRIAERTDALVIANQAMQIEVNERKRAEIEMREAQQFLRAVLDNVQNAIFVKDIKGNFVLVNQALANIFGMTIEELIGKSDVNFSHNPTEAQQFTEEDIKQLANLEDKFIPEEKHTDTNGDVYWFQTTKRSVILGENGARYLVGVATDLTERKVLESQMRHSQKMESIGQLAAGIAHEINTPTQYVGDNTRFISDAFDDIMLVLAKYAELFRSVQLGSISDELINQVEKEVNKADIQYLTVEMPNALQQSLEGISRIAKIVQSMKDFAHPGSKNIKEADLNKAIESTITVASNEWKYIANIETNFDKNLPPVPCFLGEFNQVVLNMIINASHAIGDVVGRENRDKGTITISTGKAGDWAEIRISDTGTGIPPEVQARIFDPFFTTKEVGRGTGQGLAISHNAIVEKHHGQLSFETEPGRGTTFIIRLPLKTNTETKYEEILLAA